MRYTIAEVADKLHVEKDLARGLVKFLEHYGDAEAMGTRPLARGRAETVYEFREGFEKRMMQRLRRIVDVPV